MNKAGLEIFLNISVNFPEINIIKYQYETDLLIVEVVLVKEITRDQEEKVIIRCRECVQALHILNKSKPQIFNIKFRRLAGFTFIRYYRDAESLHETEIDLLMCLLRDEFCDYLFNEGKIPCDSFKKQMKRDLLQQLNNKYGTGYLFAYRDHGRLCMFNRNTGGGL
ncbi:MAG: hypothetical protein M0P20_10705 [Methanocorpusculum sp.]|nr:hypothetical protein [Methanocorpusculum sp.]